MESRSEQFDVAVVGASLAGCTTATLLGRAGLRVALIDKHAGEDAYKRLCGHYVQASATPVFERLGLTGPIEAAGGRRHRLGASARGSSWAPTGATPRSPDWRERANAAPRTSASATWRTSPASAWRPAPA